MPSKQVVEEARAQVGSTVRGKWRLDSLLGVGGSAAVYAATHRNGKRGALKILRKELGDDLDMRTRFLREGYIANLVGHPGVVAMLDDDVDVEGTPFLVMELLEGAPLDRVVKPGRPLSTSRVLEIGEAVLDVLAAAHAQGVAHGDIKPGNVFVTKDGGVKLLDFGIAHVSEDTVRVSVEDALGTPAYMAPEQARGETIDARSDIWAVGALLFALLTGRRPREGKTLVEELTMAARDPMPPLRTVSPTVGEEIARVIDRALAFDARDRWPDATTMQQALRLSLLLEVARGPTELDALELKTTPLPNRAGPNGHVARGASPAGASRRTPPPLPAAATLRLGSRRPTPRPDPLRLLRDRDGGIDPLLATRRVDVGDLSKLSTFPPGPSTTSRIALTSSVPEDDSIVPRPRRPRRGLRVLLVAAALGAGAAFAAHDEARLSAAAEPSTPTTGVDAGAPDATRSDASR